MKVEEVKKGSDWNKTTLSDFINSITDNNFDFKGDYKITWEIEKSVRNLKDRSKDD